MSFSRIDLMERRAKLWHDMKDFLDNHRGENGTLSAMDDETYNKMEADMQALTNEISRAERMEAMDAQMNAPTSAPLTGKPAGAPMDKKTGRASEEYRNNFWNVLRAKYPSFELQNALEVGEPSEGGYLVPDEYEKTLVQALEEENVVRKLANVIRTNAGDRKIPVVVAHGSANWIDEEGLYSESNPDETFGQVTLGAYKLGTVIKVSEELLKDSVFNIESYISHEFSRRIGAAEEEAFLTGNGTGRPLGLLAATGGADVGVTTSAADKFTADDLLDLYFSLRAPYRKNAVWLLNDATISAVRKLKDGSGQYLWQPALVLGDPNTILGRPVYSSVSMPTISAGAKTIAFGDLGYYWIADREGITFKKLNELFAMNGQVGFLASKRTDGKLVLSEAVKVLQQHA